MANEETLRPSSPGPLRSAWTVAAAVVIVVAVAAAYSNSFRGEFIFDDIPSILTNESIRSLRPAEALHPPGKITVSRRPLANLSLAVNYAIGGLDVRSYHVGNLLIHLLAALTLFGIVRRTLILPALCERFGRASTALAAIVALLWALHPLQTESVTYIVQRAESLAGLCYLLTLYSVIRSAASARPWIWSAAAVIVCALGMGAKEVMVTAPIVVLLYDRVFLSGSFREAFRRRGALYLGLAATWAVLGAIMLLCPAPQHAGYGRTRITAWQFMLTQPRAILHYLRLSFWPQPLCLHYAWPAATSLREVAPQAIALAALLAATCWALVRRPALGFLGAWFFLILAPTSSVMPINDLVFEHRMYLSLAAVVAGAVIAAWALIRRIAQSDRSAAITAIVLAMAVAVALGGVTFRRNRDYRTSVSIWEDTTRKSPWNATAQYNLGTAYAEVGRLDDAIRCLSKAIEMKPEYADAYYNRGGVLARAGDHAGALRDYDKCISLAPDFADAYLNRAAEYFKTNRLDEAIQDYNRFIELRPGFVAAYFNRATIEAMTQRPGEAIADFSKAIELKPDFPEAYKDRAVTEAAAKRFPDALKDYSAAIELKPDYAEAFFGRANLYVMLRRYDGALSDCNRAIELRPAYGGAWNTRAIVHYALNQCDQAWQDVATFRKLGGTPNPSFLKALKRASGRSE